MVKSSNVINIMKKSPPKKSKLAQRYDDKLPRRQKALEGARKFLFDEEDYDGSNISEDSLSFNDEDRFSLIPRTKIQWVSQRIPFTQSSLDIGPRIEEEDETKKCLGYDRTRRLLLAFVPTVLALLIVTGTIIFRKSTKHGGGNPNDNGGSFVPQENRKNETSVSLDGMDSNVTDNSRFDIMFQSLVGYSDAKALNMQGSPQNKALRWLSDYDSSQLGPFYDHLPERYALATLFFATNTDLQPHDTFSKTNSDSGWSERSEWLSGRGICMWHGVGCPHRLINGERTARYDKDADVVQLLLGSNNIQGTLPDEIAFLDSMNVFDFSMNSIDTASLLKIATNFDYLESLNLSGNQIAAATIPDEISRLSHLRSLNISSTRLEGFIPEGIASLSKLEVLDMANNMLVGKLPEFGGFGKVTNINLSGNGFEGTVPAQYGSLSSLVELHLQSNKLDGTVPAGICTLAETGTLKNLTINCATDARFDGNQVECSCCSTCSP